MELIIAILLVVIIVGAILNRLEQNAAILAGVIALIFVAKWLNSLTH